MPAMHSSDYIHRPKSGMLRPTGSRGPVKKVLSHPVPPEVSAEIMDWLGRRVSVKSIDGHFRESGKYGDMV